MTGQLNLADLTAQQIGAQLAKNQERHEWIRPALADVLALVPTTRRCGVSLIEQELLRGVAA